jgi:hypothetical protein
MLTAELPTGEVTAAQASEAEITLDQVVAEILIQLNV